MSTGSADRRVQGIRHQPLIPARVPDHGQAGFIQDFEFSRRQNLELSTSAHHDVGFPGKPDAAPRVRSHGRRQLRIGGPFPRPIRPTYHRAVTDAPQRTVWSLAQVIKPRVALAGNRRRRAHKFFSIPKTEPKPSLGGIVFHRRHPPVARGTNQPGVAVGAGLPLALFQDQQLMFALRKQRAVPGFGHLQDAILRLVAGVGRRTPIVLPAAAPNRAASAQIAGRSNPENNR